MPPNSETRAAGRNAAGSVERAVDAVRQGNPVLVHDAADREGETDLVYPAGAVTPDAVARMRNDAGGLVCVALSDAVAEAFDLPFVREALDHPAAADHDLEYDDHSSFSLTVNHRDTYTGITDDDRALTITKLAEAAATVADDPTDATGADEPADSSGGDDRADASGTAADGTTSDSFAFAEAFRAPGHVHVLRAAPNLVADREGHTELSLALADAAGRPPATVVCEMLDDDSGGALSPAAARAYADRHGLVYVEGADVVEQLG